MKHRATAEVARARKEEEGRLRDELESAALAKVREVRALQQEMGGVQRLLEQLRRGQGEAEARV